MNMLDLCGLPAHEMARLVRDRAVSAVELLDAHLARVDRDNHEVNAVVSANFDIARAQAIAADAAVAAGDATAPLHGVPMTLKDGIDVAGLRSTVGTFELDRVPERDSTVAARLRAAGAIVFGHSNVPPWLADHQSANPVFGKTSNPWDLTRTSGGSSGGAAAAVAAGMSAREVGSDMAGSIRIPAAFCGVYGLKTTEHRVPLTGFFFPADAGPRSVRIIAALGPIARSVDDIELALRVIAGPDGFDSDVSPVALSSEPPVALDTLRVAVAPTFPGVTVSHAVQREIRRIADHAANVGDRVEERLPAVDWNEQNELFAALISTITGVFAPFAELSDEQRTLAWYLTALDRRDRATAVWHEFFNGVDAVLCPATATTAFTHRQPGEPFMIDGVSTAYGVHGGLHVFSSLCGLPALSMPVAFDETGLPIAVQLIGAPWSEIHLIDIARAFEAASITPGFRHPNPRPDARR